MRHIMRWTQWIPHFVATFYVLVFAITIVNANDTEIANQPNLTSVHQFALFDGTTTHTLRLIALREGAEARAFEGIFADTFTSVLAEMRGGEIWEYEQSSWERLPATVASLERRRLESGIVVTLSDSEVAACRLQQRSRDGNWFWYLAEHDRFIYVFLLVNQSCDQLPQNCRLRTIWENARAKPVNTK